MKTIYKLLIMGMVCLISNTTYAQIVQYSDDGTQSCIDCEEKNSSTERSCLCIVRFELDKFNHQIEASTEKEKWLYEQELLLAAAITGINYFAQYNSPTGVSPDYNFQNIQREYIKEVETNKLANEYFTKADNILKSTTGYDDGALQSSTTYSKILDIRKREGTTNPKYGDLKYNDKFLKDMTDAEVNSALNEQLGIRNHQRSAATEYGIRNSRLQRMLKDGYISNTLAGHLLVHYLSLNQEDAIRFMTRYMVWINNQKNQEIPHIIFGNPDNIFTLEDNENQYMTNLIARTGGTVPPMDGYSHPVFNEISDDVALFNYALNSFGADERNFLLGTAQNNLKKTTKGYLENHQYTFLPMDFIEKSISKYIKNEVSIDTYDPYAVPNSGTTSNTNLNDGANHVFRWKFNNDGENRGLVGASNFFNELFKLDQDHYALEGSIFRNMFKAAGVTINNMSNHDLGRLYDFSTVYPYGQYRYDMFFDVGAPYIGSLGFATVAAIAIANEGTAYFDDEITLGPSVGPCMKNIIDRLRLKDNHASVNPDISGGGTEHLSSFILNIFDKNPEYSIIFKEKQLGLDPNGNEKNGLTKNEGNNLYSITIDDDLIKKGTQLFIAKTIIHESMHAFLLYNQYDNQGTTIDVMLNRLYLKYKEEDNSNNLIQHEFIGQFVESLAHSLAAWDFHKLPMDYYENLSWGGLETSSAYKALPQTKKDKIQRIIKNERYGKSNAKGEKCP
ncbi:hypothetical protein [Aquimarina macrocephali]|uniref:hypothetical protein n=1 Tax=Aquimarina macrocephali TaxID=666563 RepID=UPI000464F149|nr:hypothetical protein [Aquimarina macrocephali]